MVTTRSASRKRDTEPLSVESELVQRPTTTKRTSKKAQHTEDISKASDVSSKPLLSAHNGAGRRQCVEDLPFTLDDLHKHIEHLFERSLIKSWYYIFQDLVLVFGSLFLTCFILPMAVKMATLFGNTMSYDVSILSEYSSMSIPMSWDNAGAFLGQSGLALFNAPFIASLSSPVLAIYTATLCFGWWLYIYLQGSFFTGLLIIGHECGHYAYFDNKALCDTVGFFLHSFVLIPFFSWQITHRRHHTYNRNQSYDETHIVPHIDELMPSVQRPQGPDYAPGVERQKYNGFYTGFKAFAHELTDALNEVNLPYRIFMYGLYCTIGFILYLFMNASGRKYPASNMVPNHFMPNSPLFSKAEAKWIIISDIGLIGMGYLLYRFTQFTNIQTLLLAYIFPYFLSQFYFIMYTLLHHTHVSLPHYSNSSWTYLRGALSTIDRSHGWLHNALWHHISDTHVVHHVFSALPFYNAQEATEILKPILGDYYMFTDEDNRWFGAAISMWKAIRDCQFIAEDHHAGLELAATAHDIVVKSNGTLPYDSPEVQNAVESVLDKAKANDPHKDGQNAAKEVYWFRSMLAQ